MSHRTHEPDQPADIGRRQSLYREVNEHIDELAATFDLSDAMEILCECASAGCNERIVLSEGEYEALRRIPTHFAVLPGHDIPEVERIVEKHDGFVVVEKFGESGIAAIELDPRRRPGTTKRPGDARGALESGLHPASGDRPE